MNTNIMKIPILDPRQIKEKQQIEAIQELEKEQQKRYEEVVEEILTVLRKRSVNLKEFGIIVALLDSKINNKIKEALVDKLLDL